MLNRLEFFDSISGIIYPRMIVDYYDHFLALKQLIEDKGKISVDHATENYIIFSIVFSSSKAKNAAMPAIQSGNIIIYNRPIQISVVASSDIEIKIQLMG